MSVILANQENVYINLQDLSIIVNGIGAIQLIHMSGFLRQKSVLSFFLSRDQKVFDAMSMKKTKETRTPSA